MASNTRAEHCGRAQEPSIAEATEGRYMCYICESDGGCNPAVVRLGISKLLYTYVKEYGIVMLRIRKAFRATTSTYKYKYIPGMYWLSVGMNYEQ